MSIKTEITEMLKNGEGNVKINEVTRLTYNTRDGLGNKCDTMTCWFSFVTGVKGGKMYAINARDYDGIIAELEECMADYFAECAKAAAKNLRAGYR